MKIAILLLALLPAQLPAQWSMKRQTAPPSRQAADGPLTPEEQKRLTTAIARLSPKQRKQLNKAIKKMTPAQQDQLAGSIKAQIARAR